MWTTLLPLALASAVVPAQWTLTLLMLRGSAGVRSALAFLSGYVVLRMVQGFVFGLLLGASSAEDTETGPGVIVASLLVAAGLLLLVKGFRAFLAGAADEDDAPPHWVQAVESYSPGRAFAVGIALLAVGAKFWVFTLSAVATLEAADLGRAVAAVNLLVFALIAVAPSLAVVVAAAVAPARSASMLDRIAAGLGRHSRVIVITICLVVGTWMLLKGLNGLGVG